MKLVTNRLALWIHNLKVSILKQASVKCSGSSAVEQKAV